MKRAKRFRAAFFFGSGISYASGAPNVGAITDLVLKTPWWAHTDGRFYLRPRDQEQVSIGDALRAQEFLRVVHGYIAPRLASRERRDPNYEDIYAAVHQILQDDTGEAPDPLIADAVAAIKLATSTLHVGQNGHIARNPFASLADRAVDLIQGAVLQGLGRITEPKGMDVIAEVINAVGDVDIFSLNHDILIESRASASRIKLVDGFGDPRGDVRIFNNQWHRDRAVARLLKLHGSINWYLFRFSDWDQYAVVKADPDHARDENGKLLNPLSPLPRVLTGTHVKEQAYGLDIFGEIFAEFRALLSRHRTLICCGYGWADKGINTRLRQWLRDARENRIVILHDGPIRNLSHTGMWWARWEEYKRAGKVVVVSRWLSACGLDHLKAYFDPV